MTGLECAGITRIFIWEELPALVLDLILRPWHLLVLFLASQLNREQQRIIEYLQVWDRGLGNNLIELGNEAGRVEGSIACRNRLGGVLRCYRRRAARCSGVDMADPLRDNSV